MKTTESLPHRILGDIRQNLGAEDPNDTSQDNRINRMSADQLFDCWCNWNGFINWSDTISSVLDNIRKSAPDK